MTKQISEKESFNREEMTKLQRKEIEQFDIVKSLICWLPSNLTNN